MSHNTKLGKNIQIAARKINDLIKYKSYDYEGPYQLR